MDITDYEMITLYLCPSIPSKEYRIRTLCVVCGNKSLYSQFKEIGTIESMSYCSEKCMKIDKFNKLPWYKKLFKRLQNEP